MAWLVCNCGRHSPESSKFCPSCGAALSSDEGQPKEPSPRLKRVSAWKRLLVFGVAGLLAVNVALCTIGLLVSESESDVGPPTQVTSPQGRTAYVPSKNMYVPGTPSVRVVPKPGTSQVRVWPTPRPAPTIGVGLSDFQSAFGGMAFEYSRLNDGRDRWIAAESDTLVEVIGPKGATEKATIVLPANPDEAMFSLMMSSVFLDAAVPGWGDDGIDWLTENLGSAIDRKVTTEVGGRGVRVRVGLEASTVLKTIMLSVEAR